MILFLSTLACSMRGAEEAPMAPAPTMQKSAENAPAGGGLATTDLEEAEEAGRGDMADRKMNEAPAAPPPPPGAKDRAEADAGATRAWFPETFLWAPRVVTDENGHASVPVRVPDSLTTWRVLGLAASRDGAQAGATLDALSTLPLYVEPVLPPWLRSGDEAEIPVRVVNTTSQDWAGNLAVELIGGLVGGGLGSVRAAAYGSAVEMLRLRAGAPGPARVRAEASGVDRVEKELEIRPVGRPVTSSRSGVLGSEDGVDLEAPAGATWARVTLTLFAGPLSVLQAELLSAPSRGGDPWSDAHSYSLGASGADLTRALGGEVEAADAEALRALRLRAQQALVRHESRADLPARAALLSAAARAGEDPVAERIAGRLRGQLLSEQLPDGTWPVPAGTTLQELLATTAWVCIALDDPGARVRAGAAFERYSAQLLDPKSGDAFTAALVLRSGAGGAELRAALEAFLRERISKNGVGNETVELPTGVLRPDHRAATRLDAVLAAAAALQDPELAATALAGYAPGTGFGSGFAGLLALDAMGRVAQEAPPGAVDVVLRMDGEEVERIRLDKEALRQTLVVRVPAPLAGEHRWELRSEGSWPGLSWHLDHEAWVPWTGAVGPDGLQVQVSHAPAALGEMSTVAILASGPVSETLLVRWEPPAGLRVDPSAVVGATVVRIDDDAVLLSVPAGHTPAVAIQLGVTPTFRGSFSSGATTVALQRAPELAASAPPERWIVK